jgi:hypothetical protein
LFFNKDKWGICEYGVSLIGKDNILDKYEILFWEGKYDIMNFRGIST